MGHAMGANTIIMAHTKPEHAPPISRPYHRSAKGQPVAKVRARCATYGLRDNFAKDNNHDGGYNHRLWATAKKRVEHD
jgi:hypothetical protein